MQHAKQRSSLRWLLLGQILIFDASRVPAQQPQPLIPKVILRSHYVILSQDDYRTLVATLRASARVRKLDAGTKGSRPCALTSPACISSHKY